MSSLNLDNLIYLSPYYAVYPDRVIELQPGGDMDRVQELTKMKIQGGPYFDQDGLTYWKVEASNDQGM